VKKSFNIQELLHCKSERHETKADAPLLLESFPKRPRTHLKHPGSVDLIGTKQNKTKQTNYLASWIDYQNQEENKVDPVRRRGEGY
jgi:hypothetical protein